MSFTAKVKDTDSLFQAIMICSDGQEHIASELLPNALYSGHLWLDVQKSKDLDNQVLYTYSKMENATVGADKLEAFDFETIHLQLRSLEGRPSKQ